MVSAYVRKIKQSSVDSHQTSPDAMLTFISWDNRDVKNYGGNNLAVRKPLVAYGDIVSVSTSNNKLSVTPSLSAVLKGGSVNYATAISPGDFVFCNMVNDQNKIDSDNSASNSLVRRAMGNSPINKYDDGFKGLYKVQTVREELSVDPQSGTKILTYRIQAFGFTEFNNIVYYDPQIFNKLNGNLRLFMSQFNEFWTNATRNKENFNVQTLVKLLIKTLIGRGLKNIATKVPSNPIRSFKVPSEVGALIGKPGAKFAADLYTFIFGRWSSSNNSASSPGQGFNPRISPQPNDGEAGTNFFDTPTTLDGNRILAAEYWNQVKVWDILKSYINITINEMYTTYRVDPNNFVSPVFIAREKTYTSEHYKGGHAASRHLRMPRWDISPNLILDKDLGKDEAARINFVQIYTRSVAPNDARNRTLQTGQGNFVVDEDDIFRHGLHPYIATAQFDFESKIATKGSEWSGLVSDWLFNGHLKHGGIIETIGIEEPISVGDKIQLDGIVYEIDSLAHTIAIDKQGRKMFRTALRVSFGVDERSDSAGPIYAESDFPDADAANRNDYSRKDTGRMKPGISDTQDIVGRSKGEKTKPVDIKSFTQNSKGIKKANDAGVIPGTEKAGSLKKNIKGKKFSKNFFEKE